MYGIVWASLWKWFFFYRIKTGPTKLFLVYLVKEINQFHCSVIPISESCRIQQSVPVIKMSFFQIEKYISTIGDILIKGYLMLMDIIQNL